MSMSTPGKFESEPPYVEEFWETFLNGGADDDGPNNEVVFFLTEEDWREWPELNGDEVLVLQEDDNGFVGHYQTTRARYERMVEGAHADASMGGDADDEYANNPEHSGLGHAEDFILGRVGRQRHASYAQLRRHAPTDTPTFRAALAHLVATGRLSAYQVQGWRGEPNLVGSAADVEAKPGDWLYAEPRVNENGTAIDRWAKDVPEKDWRVLLVEDYGPGAAYGHGYRFRVEGENLNYLPEDIDYRFSWRVRDLDDPRYDFSRAILGQHYNHNETHRRASGRFAPRPRLGVLPPAPRFSVGEHVEVVRGAFRGIEGTVRYANAGPRGDLTSVLLDHPVQRLLGPVMFSASEIRRT